jgi:serpin B
MMSQTDNEAEFKYSETDKLQVLEIPYKDEELSMTIFLPKESDMDYLEENLDQEKIKEWKNDLRKQRVNVYMPKFTFDTKYNLNETLKQLGMPSAFSGSADFSKITGGKDLFISLVVHQAFIDVNEEGTEAAAATGVVMLESAIISTETPVFRADHPFIFVIQDSENQNILFMGKVTNPSE